MGPSSKGPLQYIHARGPIQVCRETLKTGGHTENGPYRQNDPADKGTLHTRGPTDKGVIPTRGPYRQGGLIDKEFIQTKGL